MRSFVTYALVASLCACAGQPQDVPVRVALPTRLDPSSRLAIVGDLQMTPGPIRMLMRRENNRAAQAKLVADLNRRGSDAAALVVLGDLVFSGPSGADWRHFDRLIGPLATRMPVLPAIGNHDYRCFLVRWCSQSRVPKPFLRRFAWFVPGQPYTVAYGPAILVFLDSETRVLEQREWLRQMIPEWRRRYRMAIIFSHRPPFTDSVMLDAQPDPRLQHSFVAPLLDAAMPFVFFSGHAHGYEHLYLHGRHFFVSAGGGGPRGRLRFDRTDDIYTGQACRAKRDGGALRPFNYQLLYLEENSVEISTFGFCELDENVRTIERIRIPIPGAEPS